MTLGCGAMAGNITSDNVGPLHLINIKRLAYVVRTAGRSLSYRRVQAWNEAVPPRQRRAPRGTRRPADASRRRWNDIWPRAASGAAPAQPRRPSGDAPQLASQRGRPGGGPFSGSNAAPRYSATLPPAPCASCRVVPDSRRPKPGGAPGAGPAARRPAARAADRDRGFRLRGRRAAAAIRESRKIYIGPKTIVTPSARDLAARHDILVLAQR